MQFAITGPIDWIEFSETTMHNYLYPLQQLFEQNANPDNAGPMKKYLRDQFDFLGLKSPQRRLLFRQFVAEHGLPQIADLEMILLDLWQLSPREYQYTGLDLLHRLRKQIGPETINLLERLIVSKSWWDTVDALASHAVGGLLARQPPLKEATISRWRHSDNFWLRRTTLLFQLRYKEATDEALLFSLIRDNLGSDEFFINKAIGWALREYSKVNGQAVRQFVAQTALMPLSEREALKWMKNKGLVV